MKSIKLSVMSAALVVLVSVLAGCGGGGGSSSGGSTGSLSVSLQDSATEYRAVYVTINQVQVHLEGEKWEDVMAPEKAGKTYNLLSLVNGVREELGIVDLPEGSYTQMRLIIGLQPDGGINVLSEKHPFANYVVTKEDSAYHELKVPSGPQTGIKIVHGFTISEFETTEIVLDFDAGKSVVRAGNSGLWLLKPTIKVFELSEYAIVRGVVEDGEGAGIEGALVSAQQEDFDGNPVVFAATISDAEGKFALFLKPEQEDYTGGDLYNIVAYKSEYEAGCVGVVTAPKLNQIEGETSLTLTGPKATGTLTGDVLIRGADSDRYATLSFRQMKGCLGESAGPRYIEVKAENFVNGSNYSTDLTIGAYDLFASTFDEEGADQQLTNEYQDIEIAAGVYSLDIILPPPPTP